MKKWRKKHKKKTNFETRKVNKLCDNVEVSR